MSRVDGTGTLGRCETRGQYMGNSQVAETDKLGKVRPTFVDGRS